MCVYLQKTETQNPFNTYIYTLAKNEANTLKYLFKKPTCVKCLVQKVNLTFSLPNREIQQSFQIKKKTKNEKNVFNTMIKFIRLEKATQF